VNTLKTIVLAEVRVRAACEATSYAQWAAQVCKALTAVLYHQKRFRTQLSKKNHSPTQPTTPTTHKNHYTHRHRHSGTHTHTDTQTHIHTYTQTHTQPHTQTQTQTHTQTHTQTQTQTHTHKQLTKICFFVSLGRSATDTADKEVGLGHPYNSKPRVGSVATSECQVQRPVAHIMGTPRRT